MATKKAKEVLFVPVTGEAELRAIRSDDLDAMQKMVGGYIEPVRLNGRSVIYVNEEGRLNGLPLNPRLSLIANMDLVGDGFIENPSAEVVDALTKAHSAVA